MQSPLNLRRRLMIVMLVVGLVLFGLIFPFRMHGRVWSLVFDLAHAPVFFCLTLCVAGCLDPGSVGFSDRQTVSRRLTRGLVLMLCGAILLFGLAGELLQSIAGRSPTAGDLMSNAAGIAASAFWIRTGENHRMLRWMAPVIIVVAIIPPCLGLIDCIDQIQEFPLLASFERRLETSMWETRNAVIRRVRNWAIHGDHSARVEFSPGDFSEAGFFWPVANWESYDELLIDLRNPDDAPLNLRLKVADWQHRESGYPADDRYETSFTLAGRSTMTLETSLDDIRRAPVGRLMRIDQIASIRIYAVRLAEPRVLYLDHLRLEKAEMRTSPDFGSSGTDNPN